MAAGLGTPRSQNPHGKTHDRRHSDYLPGIVAHEGVGAAADLFGLGADLSRRIGYRALGSYQRELNLGTQSRDVG